VTSSLFSSLRLRDLELANRIVAGPMCQYSAIEGAAGEWHQMHLGTLAASGYGLLIIEATAVEPIGRISHGCLGLYSDETEAALARVVGLCKRQGFAAIGLQIGHAGRKGSVAPPWAGGGPLAADAGAWPTVAPSAVPHRSDMPTPEALDEAGLARVKAAFVTAAQRAERIGIDLLELHMAHGYLLHQFLSPLSNRRGDAYGGSLEQRMRYPLAVFDAVRRSWPAGKPLGVRISASDHVPGGWDIDQSRVLAQRLIGIGCDFITVSSGGVSPDQKITPGPGYQLPLVDALRDAISVPVIATGMLQDVQMAEAVVGAGRAELIAIARGALDNPHWPWHAARTLGANISHPVQYRRASPGVWRP
jgi:2,4-dienoyl-CoA reductase-like NADH-dependent reductase (Old Yellow Enzyme family)